MTREDAIKRIRYFGLYHAISDNPHSTRTVEAFEMAIKALEQPEPCEDAYMKAVWTWLLNYQIKVAELKGRYTPYEVLSWVANDWRKEHECAD